MGANSTHLSHQHCKHALAELEALADRFLAERAVVVARDAQLAEVRYSTPELLALEQRMLDSATSRAEAGCAVVAPEHLRATLDAFPTMAQDQADALTDLTRSGAGVSLLVGKAGYGKTFVAGRQRIPMACKGTASLVARRPGLPRLD
jgi:hypothetical protein